MFALYSECLDVHPFFEAYAELIRVQQDVDPTDALRVAYQNHPHTFIFALMSLILAIQLFGLGLLAYQAKHYHDNLFHLGSTMYRWMAESRQAAGSHCRLAPGRRAAGFARRGSSPEARCHPCWCLHDSGFADPAAGWLLARRHRPARHVGIIGGGVLGMTLALRLRQAGADVTLLEAADRGGGLAGAAPIGGYTWDRFYHVILLSDRHTRSLLEELGLARSPALGHHAHRLLHRRPAALALHQLEFLRFPPLSLIDKLQARRDDLPGLAAARLAAPGVACSRSTG